MERRFLEILVMAFLAFGFFGCNDESTEYVPYAVPAAAMEDVSTEEPAASTINLEWNSYDCPITATLTPAEAKSAAVSTQEISLPKVAFLSDGRMVVAEADYMNAGLLEIAVETAAGSKAFNAVELDATALKNGETVYNYVNFAALEDDNSLVIGVGFAASANIFRIDLTSGAAAAICPSDSYAGYIFDGRLYVSYADPITYAPAVRVIDLADGSITEIINVTGASAGILATADKVYTASGLGDYCGQIRSFTAEDYETAPADFATAGELFFEADSAGSLALVADCMLVGNSLWGQDNVCSIVALENGFEIIAFDLNAGNTDSYDVSVGGGRVAVLNSQWKYYDYGDFGYFGIEKSNISTMPTAQLESVLNALY